MFVERRWMERKGMESVICICVMKMIMGKVGHTDSCLKCVFAEDKFHEFGKKIKLLLQGLVHG